MHNGARPSDTGAQIDLESVTKVYRGSTEETIKGIDLSIREGEFMTFLGSSGTGKTTTLNMIAGFETVTTGNIHLDGRDISRLKPHERGLGMVFQNYALFPHMTVRENIGFPLKQRKVSSKQLTRQVNEALDLVDLGEFGERLPSQLSGGQQQRVALARAIVYSPRVLLLDEPLGALDRRLREFLQVEISRIHRELGLTFVYVTHDQEEALGMSDRIAVFRDGRIEQVGTPTEVYESPANSFVATFLGDSNVFSGTLKGEVLDTGWAEFKVDVGTSSSQQSRAMDLVVRPEHMSIGDPPAGPHNSINGRVISVMFQGAYRRVSMELSNGQDCLVREPASVRSGVSVGDRVNVWWHPVSGIAVTEEKAVA